MVYKHAYKARERETDRETELQTVSVWSTTAFKKYKSPELLKDQSSAVKTLLRVCVQELNREIKKCLSKTAKLKGDLAVKKGSGGQKEQKWVEMYQGLGKSCIREIWTKAAVRSQIQSSKTTTFSPAQLMLTGSHWYIRQKPQKEMFIITRPCSSSSRRLKRIGQFRWKISSLSWSIEQTYTYTCHENIVTFNLNYFLSPYSVYHILWNIRCVCYHVKHAATSKATYTMRLMSSFQKKKHFGEM